MKNKYRIIANIIFLAILCMFAFNTNVYGASATINVSKTSVETGTSVTITANVSGAASWSLDATASGGTLTKADSRVGNTDNGENGSATVTIGTFVANTAGTYTISLSGYVVDASGDEPTRVNVSGSKTITVNAPAPSGGDSGSSSSGDNGSNPGSNSGSSGSSTPATTPAEPKFKDVSKTVYATGDINLRASWSTSSAATQITKGTELRLTGTSTEKINGYVWYRVTYNGKIKYVASSLVTETKPEEEEKSKNVDLKSIIIEGAELNPKFSNSVTEYSATLKDFDGKELKVTAEPVDEKTTVTIEGNKDIKDGKNTITITAKAEDGTTRITTINVTKEDNKAFGLGKLVIKDVEIKNFTTDNFEYKVDFKDLDKLEITAVPTEEDATVEIIGNENLQDGENIITIMVKSKDGEKTATYQIKATKLTSTEEVAKKEINPINIALCVLFALIAIILITLLVMKYVRDNNDYDDEDIENDYDNDYKEDNVYSSNFEEKDANEEALETDAEAEEQIEDEETSNVEETDNFNEEIGEIYDEVRKEKEVEEVETKVEEKKPTIDDLFNYDYNDYDESSRRARRGKGKHSK